MFKKLVLIVGGLLLTCVAALAVTIFAAGFTNPVLWAQRQLTAMSVKGGPEVVLEVDADAVRHRAYELLRRDAVSLLRGERLRFSTQLTEAGLEIKAQVEDRPKVVSQLRGQYGDNIDIKSTDDGTMRVGFTDAGLTERTRRAAELSQELITERLSDLGMGVVVTVQPREAGAARLLVQMARTADPKRLTEFATKPGELGFRLIDVSMNPQNAVASGAPSGAEVLYGRPATGKEPYVVEKRVLMSGADLVDAQPGFDQRTNEPIVSFRFSTAGARKFAQATTENVGRPFAIVVDGEVLAAPIIREPITGGSGQISGGFTVQSANDLAVVLRHGELPAKLKVVEVRPAKGQ